MTEKLLIELFDANLTPEEKEERAKETILALLKERTLQDELETEAINMMAFSDHILRSIYRQSRPGPMAAAARGPCLCGGLFLPLLPWHRYCAQPKG